MKTEVLHNYIVLQEWTVLTDFDATCPKLGETVSVHRISLPRSFVKLTCSKQYLSI